MEFVCGAGIWGGGGGGRGGGAAAGDSGMIEDTLFGKLLRDTEPPKKTMQKSILDVKLAGKSRHNNAGKKKKKKGGAEGGAEDAGVNSATQDVMRKALKGKLSSTLSPSLPYPPLYLL